MEIDGIPLFITFVKFGLRIVGQNDEVSQSAAKKLAIRIQKAVKAAAPFFEWMAESAIRDSAVSVLNKSADLLARFRFLRDLHREKSGEADLRSKEVIETRGTNEAGGTWTQFSRPSFQMRKEAKWLGLAAVEAFFSWSEHVFIHLAVLRGNVTTAEDVTRTAEADWAAKFRAALDVDDPKTKRFYDHLLVTWKHLRNFVAHGSFGKDGEAFHFHSPAGAVPIVLPHPIGSRAFSFATTTSWDVGSALNLIDDFMIHLWEGSRAAAKVHIEDYDLPTVLLFARDGTYAPAMASPMEMTRFAETMSDER